jgi:hypothetical protein
VEECGIAQGIWPKGKVHCLRPSSASLKQLLARALQEVADGLLGDAILEVSVYATEGEFLVLLVACLLEHIVGESTVVAMIMLNFTPCLAAKDSKACLAATVLTDELST